jgi:hypothetical protein
VAVTTTRTVIPLDAAAYARHALHADDRVWVEKNCYIDVWIELVHALGCDPLAMLPFVVAIDFEGDQWTFFKPPHGELRELYGLDVQELNVWRPLLEHVIEHLGDHKVISTEASAFWLPDTSGTDYRTQHTKTTIIINDIDVEAGRLGYFHNAGYFTLDGEDFARTFRVGAAPDPTFMPLFAETVRVNHAVRRTPGELRALARRYLATHIARRPVDNPVVRFGERFQAELPAITDKGLAYYHAWAFATIRQLGAAAELAAQHLTWTGDAALGAAAAAYDQVSAACKTFILKAARAVNAKRAMDTTELFRTMADAWQAGGDAVAAAVGGQAPR